MSYFDYFDLLYPILGHFGPILSHFEEFGRVWERPWTAKAFGAVKMAQNSVGEGRGPPRVGEGGGPPRGSQIRRDFYKGVENPTLNVGEGVPHA